MYQMAATPRRATARPRTSQTGKTGTRFSDMEDHPLVVEGRDIGSVVFPGTPFKFYIDASPGVRAKRRAAQGHRDEIARRDHADSSRAASPLVIAKDAVVIDTSTLTIPQVVEEIVSRLRSKGLQIQSHS